MQQQPNNDDAIIGQEDLQHFAQLEGKMLFVCGHCMTEFPTVNEWLAHGFKVHPGVGFCELYLREPNSKTLLGPDNFEFQGGVSN